MGAHRLDRWQTGARTPLGPVAGPEGFRRLVTRQDRGKLTQDKLESEFLHHQWEQEGLIQRGALAGLNQSAAQAEDVAAMAACLASGPVSLAIDNQSTLDFIQDITRREHEGVSSSARLRYGETSVRVATERIIRLKGLGGGLA